MRSPKWLRDEILLCLDLYLNHNGNKIQKNDPKVAELSDILNKLPIVSNKVEYEKFRNENGVIMKLGNFKQAWNYIRKRNITDEMIEKFKGYRE